MSLDQTLQGIDTGISDIPSVTEVSVDSINTYLPGPRRLVYQGFAFTIEHLGQPEPKAQPMSGIEALIPGPLVGPDFLDLCRGEGHNDTPVTGECLTAVCRALRDYASVPPSELQFQMGDIIAVVTISESGWCDGIVRGKRGRFPSSYVETLPGDIYGQPKGTLHGTQANCHMPSLPR